MHLLSIPAVVLTLVQAYQSGSDATTTYFTRAQAMLSTDDFDAHLVA